MSTTAKKFALPLILMLATSLSAQVTLKKGAVVYTGSAANTTAPASIVEEKVREATPEWKKMQDEGIDEDSAQGKQLIQRMNKRIRKAVKDIANSESRDLVTRKKDIKDDQGRTVVDLTEKVIEKIEE